MYNKKEGSRLINRSLHRYGTLLIAQQNSNLKKLFLSILCKNLRNQNLNKLIVLGENRGDSAWEIFTLYGRRTY